MALGFVRYTRGLGRKRIVILNDSEESGSCSMIREKSNTNPLKKQCSREIKFDDSEANSCSISASMMNPLTKQCSREIKFDDSEENSCSISASMLKKQCSISASMSPLKKQCSSEVNSCLISASMSSLKKQCSREMRRFDDSEENSCSISASMGPLKKQCSREIKFDDTEISLLENLPQDILVRVLCGVNHEDLKQLFHVSKSIRQATSIAKQYHFAYTTPTKTRVFPKSIDFENQGELDEIETPNAPKQVRLNRSRISDKKLSDISVSLFASRDEEHWPKKGLIFDTEV